MYFICFFLKRSRKKYLSWCVERERCLVGFFFLICKEGVGGEFVVLGGEVVVFLGEMSFGLVRWVGI